MAADEIEVVITKAMLWTAERYGASGDPRLPDWVRPEVQDALTGLWTRSTTESASEITAQFKSDCYPHLETKAAEQSLFARIVQEFIERYGAAKIVRIVEATAEQIRRLISIGQRDGLSVPETARMIAERTPEIARLRATVIARTELHSSSQFASQRVAQESRFPLRKRWNSTADHRTRDFGEADGIVDEYSHRAMNGATVELDQPFMVPTKMGWNEPLMFPGDPNGSAANVINCRCVQTYERVK